MCVFVSATTVWLSTAPRPVVADEPKKGDAESELLRRAEAIKPTPAELKWQNIPWVLDLAEGQRLARTEGRPIFLWVSGDAPLGRC
jgi:hypothetical protein